MTATRPEAAREPSPLVLTAKLATIAVMLSIQLTLSYFFAQLSRMTSPYPPQLWAIAVATVVSVAIAIPMVWGVIGGSVPTVRRWKAALVMVAVVVALELVALVPFWQRSDSVNGVIAVFCGLAAAAAGLGLCFRSLFARTLEAFGVLSVAALSLLAIVPVDAPDAQLLAEQQQAEIDQEQHAFAIGRRDTYIETGTYPMLTDASGWHAVWVSVSDSDVGTWLLSDDGVAAEVHVYPQVTRDTTVGGIPCGYLRRDGDATITPGAELPAWCEATASGWRRADGTGIAFFPPGGVFAAVMATDLPSQQVPAASASATRDEVAAIAAGLRNMTRDEVVAEVADGWLSGDLWFQRPVSVGP